MIKKIIGCLFFSMFFLSSCTAPEGYLSITDISNVSYPEFCISSRPDCKGKFIETTVGYEFDEISKSGDFIKTVWSVSKTYKKKVGMKRFKYGISPDGWEENMVAEPLIMGHYYRVGGAFVFTCQKENYQNKCEVYELGKFIRQFNN